MSKRTIPKPRSKAQERILRQMRKIVKDLEPGSTPRNAQYLCYASEICGNDLFEGDIIDYWTAFSGKDPSDNEYYEIVATFEHPTITAKFPEKPGDFLEYEYVWVRETDRHMTEAKEAADDRAIELDDYHDFIGENDGDVLLLAQIPKAKRV